ncbi:MAG: OmpA family protein [Pseudomonadaceae bacterium]|nr:OmpA family protein [Pseudomonadaceae bacterium]
MLNAYANKDHIVGPTEGFDISRSPRRVRSTFTAPRSGARTLWRCLGSAFLVLAVSVLSVPVHAVPPNTTITNTADAQFSIGGVPFSISDSQSFVTINRAPIGVTLSSSAVEADASGAVVGQLTAIDEDVDDAFVFTVSDPRFEVVGDVLKLRDGETLALGERVDVTVTVTDLAGANASSDSTIVGTPPGSGDNTNAFVRVLQLAPSGGSSTLVNATSCSTSGSDAGPFQTLTVTDFSGANLLVPGSLDLLPSQAFVTGEPLFFELRDLDANEDPSAIEQVGVRITSTLGDEEFLQLSETSVDSGIFVGYLQTVAPTSVVGDCRLATSSNADVTVSYSDPDDPLDSVSANVLVDPLGVVFDSASGRPIDGAVVSLVDNATGLPARVFGDDGVSIYPSTVVSGAGATDASGSVYDFGPGLFRFPFVAAGDYRLEIQPPDRFTYPSIVADAALQLLPDAPYALSGGSRGDAFNVPIGPAVRVDVPLDLQPIVATDSEVSISAFTPSGPSASATPVAAGQCFDGSAFAAQPPPISALGPLVVPGLIDLTPTDRLVRGETAFVEVDDADQNVDAFAPDRIVIEVSSSSGDSERLELVETGNSTGIFVGYIQTSTVSVVPFDCQLEAAAGDELTVSYTDVARPADQTSASALLDGGFRTFLSGDGSVVDGLEVTLVDAVTGLPATNAVFASDGVTPYPATLTSGGSVADPILGTIDFAPGSFRWPVIAPGSYQLAVATPPELLFPSVATDAQIAGLPTVFEVVQGSRGETFAVTAGVGTGFDVPLDQINADIVLTKEASSSTASVGDFVQYRIEVRNAAAAGDVSSLTLLDRLPLGFRLVTSSVRLDGQTTSAVVADDGRSLELTIDRVAAADSRVLSYVAEVTAGTQVGLARNIVSLTGVGVGSSNEASADVEIVDDLFNSSAMIVGQIVEGECDSTGVPVSGVRVFDETGSYVVTDIDGRFHFEDVAPGGHVLQLDTASIPAHLEPVLCDDSNRRAGNSISQFVDVQAGTLWRADFRLQQKPPVLVDVRGQLFADVSAESVGYRFELRAGELAASNAVAIVMLDSALKYVPGSARLNGATINEPEIANGALTFRLADNAGAFAHSIEFAAERIAEPASARFSTKATLLLDSSAGKVRLPVVTSEVSSGGAFVERMEVSATTLFAEASADLDELAIAQLGELASSVARADDIAVNLVGHADNQPLSERALQTFADNQALSEARAAQVAQALEGQLPGNVAIVASGAGDREPIASNKTEIGRAANRRVDVEIRARTNIEEREDDGSVSDVSVISVALAPSAVDSTASRLPAYEEIKAPSFDRAWLAGNYSGRAIAWPTEDHNPAIPAIRLAVAHEPGARVDVQVNGELVNPLTFDGTTADHSTGAAISQWRNLSLAPGDNAIVVSIGAADGSVETLERRVHYAGAPVRAELVEDLSRLEADGIEPPVVAVRLYDIDGYPARPGTTGDFFVDAPYAAFNDARHLNELGGSNTGYQRYVVRNDGLAYIELEPTNDGGEVVLRFQFDRNRADNVRARLKPVAREWILVGYAEGTAGYRALSGAARNDADLGLAEDFVSDSRVAFYAKGQVPGEALLTLAYDSDGNGASDELKRQIDPNRFYTLYGDGSEQRFDARSQRKLYVKLEREDFSAMFGDFDTRFDDTELTRYSRSLNGLRAEYIGDKLGATVFASEADQGLVRDEIRGDGTSGLYRLSSSAIVRNTEQIHIVVRDRFRSERILERTPLTRYLDYTIDYDAGTVFFKQPIASQTPQFNPITIDVEYEVQAGTGDEVIAGGRVAWRLDDEDSEVALTHIRDETSGRGGELTGAHLRWQIGDETMVRAEAATTESDSTPSANAYLVEVERQSSRVAGRAYVREQESGFGLGQQSVGEDGTRKLGVDGEVRLSENVLARAEAFNQEQLDGDGSRRVLSAELERRGQNTRVSGGVRHVSETTADGGAADSELITLGVARQLFAGRLNLSANAELGLAGGAGNTDYPDRLLLGGEYRLFSNLSLIAEQEFTWDDLRDTQDTRFGLSMRPWTGGDINAIVQRQQGENGDRLFATTGLLQQWRHGEHWLFDVGLDRVHTMSGSAQAQDPGALLANPNVDVASGSVGNDFTAAFVGFGYRREQWDVTGRVEMHAGDATDKWNLLAGASRQLDEGRVLSSSLQWLLEDGDDGSRRRAADLRGGLAWRPDQARWLWLARLDLVTDDVDNASFRLSTRKLVANVHANATMSRASQLALRFGLKQVRQTFDGDSYDGLTALIGAEYRHDIGRRFDIGLHGSVLHTANSDTSKYGAGVSVGVNPLDDVWISLGYNLIGFADNDFDGAQYTDQGLFLRLRVKLDQNLINRFFNRSLIEDELPR